MPNCSRCGADNETSANFCRNCGNAMASQGYAPPPPPPGHGYAPPPPPPPPPGQGYPPPPPGYYPPPYGQAESGLQQNIAALLCYVLGWLSGLVFFFVDKRPFVRFHAMQSMILFGGIHVLHLVLTWVLFPALRLWSLLFMISGIISLVSLVLWVLLMVKAYQNEWYKVPVVGDIALQKSQQM